MRAWKDIFDAAGSAPQLYEDIKDDLPPMETQAKTSRPPFEPVDEIALIARRLIYGEMMDFADGVFEHVPAGRINTATELANAIHRWAERRGAC